MTPVEHSEQFRGLLAARLPEVAAGIDAGVRGLLAGELGAFARATNAAIRSGDAATVLRHFAVADEWFGSADPDGSRALAACYLEALALCGRPARQIDARGLLSPALARALADLEADEEADQPRSGSGPFPSRFRVAWPPHPDPPPQGGREQ